MPRLPRIRLEGAAHYVTAKGLGSQEIFRDNSDYATYLDMLKKYKELHGFKLFSFLLLPERIHLLVEDGPQASISEIMHDLNSLYTKYFNGRYDRKGHLFEARFRSVLIEKESSLLNMTCHIHRATPAGHPYGSFQMYQAMPASSPCIGLDLQEEIKEVKAFLSNKNNALSYEAYCRDSQEMDAFEKSLGRSKIVGSQKFVERARAKISERAAQLEQKEKAVFMSAFRRNLYVLLFVFAVTTATASSIYLYTGKRSADSKYQNLLAAREAEFIERTRFENQTPLSPSSLEGSQWTIEMSTARGSFQDTIRFHNGRFSSDFFSRMGFKTSNYFLVPQDGKRTLWQAAQSSPAGDSLAWRGTWQGDAMKGHVSFRTAGKAVQEYSFFSKEWAYLN